MREKYSTNIEEEEMEDMIDFSEVYWNSGYKEGFKEGFKEAYEEAFEEAFEEEFKKDYREGRREMALKMIKFMSESGQSAASVQLALKGIQEAGLAFDTLVTVLPPEQTREIRRRLLDAGNTPAMHKHQTSANTPTPRI